MFLSTLATDISVGLGSWVSGELEQEENNSKITSEDQLEVLRSAQEKPEHLSDGSEDDIQVL